MSMNGNEMDFPKLPQSWDDWTITEKVGEGSYGSVYKAERPVGRDKVCSAIKIVHIPADNTETLEMRRILQREDSIVAYYQDMVDSYIREIQAMERLTGITNIVSIQDYHVDRAQDEISWDIYIRMEFLTSFSSYHVSNHLDEKEIVRLGIDICNALEYCEKVRIIHRDIKPDNIFVSKLGNYKLGDFGVARFIDRTQSTMASKGTFSYMAPEVFHGEQFDHRADIYSLGLVLYRLLNKNREPFLPADNQLIYYKDREHALQKRMSGEMPPAPADASPTLSKIILKAISYDPKNRYQTAAEFKRNLAAWSESQTEEEISGTSGPNSHLKAIQVSLTVAALFIIMILVKNGSSNSLKESTLLTGDTESAPETVLSETIISQTETLKMIPKSETEAVLPKVQGEIVPETEPVSEKAPATTIANDKPEIVDSEATESDPGKTDKSSSDDNDHVKTSDKAGESSADEAIEIDISQCAGFIFREGRVVKYFFPKVLQDLLVETAGIDPDSDLCRQITENFNESQFSVSPERRDYSVGEVVTMKFDPTAEYEELLEEARCTFKYKGKGKAYQG